VNWHIAYSRGHMGKSHANMLLGTNIEKGRILYLVSGISKREAEGRVKQTMEHKARFRVCPPSD